jgi:hypothetical protein
MIVLNFIIGLLAVAIPLAIIYGLGKWVTKGELYVDTAEVFLRGCIAVILLVVSIFGLIFIYAVGSRIVDKLI